MVLFKGCYARAVAKGFCVYAKFEMVSCAKVTKPISGNNNNVLTICTGATALVIASQVIKTCLIKTLVINLAVILINKL